VGRVVPFSERAVQPASLSSNTLVASPPRSAVIRMARENERWGYTRIRDALTNLGHEISRDTAANILRDHGIKPGQSDDEAGARLPTACDQARLRPPGSGAASFTSAALQRSGQRRFLQNARPEPVFK